LAITVLLLASCWDASAFLFSVRPFESSLGLSILGNADDGRQGVVCDHICGGDPGVWDAPPIACPICGRKGIWLDASTGSACDGARGFSYREAKSSPIATATRFASSLFLAAAHRALPQGCLAITPLFLQPF